MNHISNLSRLLNPEPPREPPRPQPPPPPEQMEEVDDDDSSTYAVTEEDEDNFFRMLHGRRVNAMSSLYLLPGDKDELQRLLREHWLCQIVLGGKNYVGPVAQLLKSRPRRKRRVLDCGTGGGLWSIEMAAEFPDVEVIGVDLAPMQPRHIPPNCSFELFDLDGQRLPYPNAWFDVVHARSVYMGIRNYPQFLRELARVLRPGGLIILAEMDSTALTDGKKPIGPGAIGGAPGWYSFWEQYRSTLAHQGVDVKIPTKMRSLLGDIKYFENVIAQEALIPVGFWPKDPVLLTIGQLAWMDYDSFLPACRPMFRESGLSESTVNQLIEDAQRDLYHPVVRPSVCLHIAHARRTLEPWPIRYSP